MRARTWLVVRWTVGIGILAVIATKIDFARLALLWEPRTFAYLGGAASILVLAQFVSAARWKMLLDEDPVSWPFLVRLYLIGNFFSAFLPTSVGGDAVRTGALARERVALRRSIASVLLDRMLGVAGMVPLFVAGALLITAGPARLMDSLRFEASAGQVLAVSAVFVTVVGGAALIFRRDLWAKLVEFGDEFRDLAGSARKLAVVLVLGVVVQAMYVCAWGLLVPPTGLELGWGVLLFAVPVVSVVAMLPVSIAGLGVREGVWIVLLGGGFPTADVVAFSLLYFVAFSLAGAVGGALYVLRGLSSGAAGLPEGDVSVPEKFVS